MLRQPNPPGEAAADMLRRINAIFTAQAICVAAELGIADHLADGPRSVDEVASGTGAHRGSLHRLLRLLAGTDVFREDEDGRFALTALGETLRSDGPESVRDWALFIGAPELWQVFGRLRDSVMTGEAAFPREHGVALWDYMAEHPDLGSAFNRWMSRQSDQHNAAIVSAYDFSTVRTVADIGGGQGSTLATIMRDHPSLKGVLLDLPHVVEHTDVLESAVTTGHCEVIGGDMLQSVPAGADAYVIKRVLMDWGDEPAEKILRHCAEAMTDGGKVLVVEMVLPPGGQPSPARTFDMIMLLNQPGGRLRTEAEFRSLFSAAGLELVRVIPTASPNSILEGVRA